MTETFENYDEEFKGATGIIATKISLLPNVSGGEKNSSIAEIEKELANAQALVEQMDLEARSSTGETRAEMQTRARTHKTTLTDLKNNLRDARAAFPTSVQAQRDDLLGGARRAGQPSAELTAEAQNQRQRLLAQTDALGKTSSRLEQTQRIVMETEEIGINILSDLDQQRQTLEGTRDKLRGADTDLARSRRILQGMARRALANKLIMVGIIVTLVFFIGLIVYIQWFSDGDSSSSSSAKAPAAASPQGAGSG
mmetsp:Transcript_26475/g.71542  ORF Transcript_26475/g.71542 Transcript_26475/m.71542 type:complete len:254 (+) Transcript_26475:69-830(+)